MSVVVDGVDDKDDWTVAVVVAVVVAVAIAVAAAAIDDRRADGFPPSDIPSPERA